MTALAIRPIAEIGMSAVRALFERIPDGDHTFFREDVLAPGVVESWAEDRAGHRFVAMIDDDAVGYLALIPGVGWSTHVVELRIVVDPDRRRKGIGRALARHAVVTAADHGWTKLMVNVVAEQQATIDMFAALGFAPEGLLKDHVRSTTGEVHDLLVLSHDVEELRDTMSVAGLDDAVDG